MLRMKYFIYHPQPGKNPPTQVECASFDKAKAEYKRLQEIYPSREMCLIVENDYGDQTKIHAGRWD